LRHAGQGALVIHDIRVKYAPRTWYRVECSQAVHNIVRRERRGIRPFGTRHQNGLRLSTVTSPWNWPMQFATAPVLGRFRLKAIEEGGAVPSVAHLITTVIMQLATNVNYLLTH